MSDRTRIHVHSLKINVRDTQRVGRILEMTEQLEMGLLVDHINTINLVQEAVKRSCIQFL